MVVLALALFLGLTLSFFLRAPLCRACDLARPRVARAWRLALGALRGYDIEAEVDFLKLRLSRANQILMSPPVRVAAIVETAEEVVDMPGVSRLHMQAKIGHVPSLCIKADHVWETARMLDLDGIRQRRLTPAFDSIESARATMARDLGAAIVLGKKGDPRTRAAG